MAAMAAGRGLKVSTFVADVTPPMGAPLCYGLVPVASEVVDKLWARGVVLRPAGEKPIVLCAVDWLGIGNGCRSGWHCIRYISTTRRGMTCRRTRFCRRECHYVMWILRVARRGEWRRL